MNNLFIVIKESVMENLIDKIAKLKIKIVEDKKILNISSDVSVDFSKASMSWNLCHTNSEILIFKNIYRSSNKIQIMNKMLFDQKCKEIQRIVAKKILENNEKELHNLKNIQQVLNIIKTFNY